MCTKSHCIIGYVVFVALLLGLYFGVARYINNSTPIVSIETGSIDTVESGSVESMILDILDTGTVATGTVTGVIQPEIEEKVE